MYQFAAPMNWDMEEQTQSVCWKAEDTQSVLLHASGG